MPFPREKTHLHLIIRHTLPESFGKGVVVDLQLGHLVVLVGCHPNEGALHQVLGEDRLLVALGDEL